MNDNCFSQEIISPLDYNPVIQQHLNQYGVSELKMQVVPDTLTLPFLDDFSQDGIYPSTERWLDKEVFINSDLARNMPTVGVATFDGLNEYGNPYSPGSTISGWADTLTSKSIYREIILIRFSVFNS